jgi:hypothetical protein
MTRQGVSAREQAVRAQGGLEAPLPGFEIGRVVARIRLNMRKPA